MGLYSISLFMIMSVGFLECEMKLECCKLGTGVETQRWQRDTTCDDNV